MKNAGNIGKGAAATGGLVLAACAACCAPLVVPLIAPWVVGVLAVGGAGFAVAGQVAVALAIVAAAAGYIWFSRRRRAPATPAATAIKDGGCGCGPDSTLELPTGERKLLEQGQV